MRLPRSFPGVLVGLLLVTVFISRAVPRSLATDFTLGVVGPIFGFVVVVAFATAVALDRSASKRSPRSNRSRRPRR